MKNISRIQSKVESFIYNKQYNLSEIGIKLRNKKNVLMT